MCSTDLSILDFLFDKQDPILNSVESKNWEIGLKDIGLNNNCISDPKANLLESALKDSEMDLGVSWGPDADDFLDFLNVKDETVVLDEQVLHPSDTSDSGVSSDVGFDDRLSPLFFGKDEGSLPLLSKLYDVDNSLGSDQSNDAQSTTTEETEVDLSICDVVGSSNIGEVMVQDNEAAINMDVVTSPQKKPVVLAKCAPKIIHLPRQVIKLTSSAKSGTRSILLPVSVNDVCNIKTIKIVNAGNGVPTPQFRTVITVPPAKKARITHPNSESDDVDGLCIETSGHTSDDSDSPYPILELSGEEKRLLKKEGVILPTHYPLTKEEERELKRIRRKIRNKISAQDSRKRKKEYVDGLEARVKKCTEENFALQKRVKHLENQNQTLTSQLKRLQSLMTGPAVRPAQPATCLMVLLLSLALVMAPNFRPGQNVTGGNAGMDESSDLSTTDVESMPVAGRSRSLLHQPVMTLDTADDDLLDNISTELSHLQDHDYEPPIKLSRSLPHATKHFLYSTERIDHLQSEAGDPWRPPPKPGENLMEQMKSITEEMKVNISNPGGTRTVLLQVPKNV